MKACDKKKGDMINRKIQQQMDGKKAMQDTEQKRRAQVGKGINRSIQKKSGK